MDNLTRYFSAWRVIRAGHREIVEGLVPAEHRGPSADLRAALAAWPHAHYWARRDHSELVLIRPLDQAPREAWLLHGVLLLVTVVCVLGAGAALAGVYFPPLGSGLGGHLMAGLRFFPDFVALRLPLLLSGWSFAAPFLGILLVHELGHYVTARRYGIDASPPYLLPIPPTLSPLGSVGAFLRLRSPVVDRRQLLDVGAAGPLAGFLVVLGVLAWGYATSAAVPPGFGRSTTFISFDGVNYPLGDSLLTHAFREWFHPGAASLHLSLPAFAGWAGALITGLNLLPLSQLDGGHISYGLLGRYQAPVGLAALLGLVWLSQYWSAWLIWVLLTLVVGGWRWSHPSVVCPERPVMARGLVLGLLSVLVLVATFVPVPFGQ
jgi:hypothetical protein